MFAECFSFGSTDSDSHFLLHRGLYDTQTLIL